MILAGLGAAIALASADAAIDETEFFRDSLPPAPPTTVHAATDSGIQVSFSGDASAVGQVSWRRRGLDSSAGDAGFSVVTDGTIQARLSTGSRVLVALEADHNATQDTTTFHLREAFVDGNILGYAWIRAGKQVLQWGRGILWTPTDLVNVEGKSLVPRAGSREGATGVRLQVPIGNRANAYLFSDLSGVRTADSLSVAWRLETTAGPSELAVSGWHQPESPTALGVDGSVGVRGWDLQAGAVWLSGDLVSRPKLENGRWSSYRDDDRSQVRAGGGLGRGFTVGGHPDRLRVDVEGFWQSDAVGTGLLSATGTAPVAMPSSILLMAPSTAGATMPMPGYAYMAQNGMYTANQMGSAYVAAMASFSRFVHQDLTLTGQGLSNLDDRSGLATLALSWRTFRGVSAQVTGYWFWGDRGTEMALSGVGPAVETRLGISF